VWVICGLALLHVQEVLAGIVYTASSQATGLWAAVPGAVIRRYFRQLHHIFFVLRKGKKLYRNIGRFLYQVPGYHKPDIEITP
jgi:hypothetical protein